MIALFPGASCVVLCLLPHPFLPERFIQRRSAEQRPEDGDGDVEMGEMASAEGGFPCFLCCGGSDEDEPEDEMPDIASGELDLTELPTFRNFFFLILATS